jgi:hypothetical protein
MDNYERFFKEHDAPEPPAGFAHLIMARIERRERRLRAVKMGITVGIFGASLALMAIGFNDFRNAVGETGFLQFGALLFSDFSMTISNFPDFALSMLEALPIFSSIVMLLGMGLAVWSAAAMVDEISFVEQKHHLLPR